MIPPPRPGPLEIALDTLHAYALAASLAWASGIRLYAAVFLAGLLGRLQVVHLPGRTGRAAGQLGARRGGRADGRRIPRRQGAGFRQRLGCRAHFIRIPAGVLLSGASFAIRRRLQLAAALLGGAIASGTHLTKAGGRALINTSPEPSATGAPV